MGGLKYPILLVHGMGFHDHRIFNYWGRIPRKLEAQGNRIFYGKQDSHGSAESNGRFLYGRLQEILEETGDMAGAGEATGAPEAATST